MSKEACLTCITGIWTKCPWFKMYDIVEIKSVSVLSNGFCKCKFQYTLLQECHFRLWPMCMTIHTLYLKLKQHNFKLSFEKWYRWCMKSLKCLSLNCNCQINRISYNKIHLENARIDNRITNIFFLFYHNDILINELLELRMDQ